MSNQFSYKSSGIDIEQTNLAKQKMADSLVKNSKKNILNKPGAFASLIKIDFGTYKSPVLIMKTEEPGSKQLICAEQDRLETICMDMIHHLINDCIVMGGHPVSVQDAIILESFDESSVLRMVKAMSEICKENDCSLSGGETSIQPGVLQKDTFILTSSIIGVAEEDEIIDGSKIKKDQVVLCLASNGPHTNGYTLIRNLIKNKPEILKETVDGTSFLEAILKPHICYYSALKGLFSKKIITGLAHITGGGVSDNLARVLPSDVDACIDKKLIKVPEVFTLMQKYSELDQYELYKTFNMGVGMCLVCDVDNEIEITKHITSFGISCYKIGNTISGTGKVRF